MFRLARGLPVLEGFGRIQYFNNQIPEIERVDTVHAKTARPKKEYQIRLSCVRLMSVSYTSKFLKTNA